MFILNTDIGKTQNFNDGVQGTYRILVDCISHTSVVTDKYISLTTNILCFLFIFKNIQGKHELPNTVMIRPEPEVLTTGFAKVRVPLIHTRHIL